MIVYNIDGLYRQVVQLCYKAASFIDICNLGAEMGWLVEQLIIIRQAVQKWESFQIREFHDSFPK